VPGGTEAVPVAAIVSSPMLDRVDGGRAVLLGLADAQRLFDHPGRIDQVLLAARPGVSMSSLQHDLANQLNGTALVGPPGGATGAGSKDLASYLLVTQAGGLIALVVAAVLVFNTMAIAMAERRRDIALARSLGATRRQLLAAALAEAAFVGAAGTALGLIAGGVLAQLVVPLARYAYQAVSPVDTPS